MLFLISVLGLHKRADTHLTLSHLFNEQLCKNKNGTVCGFIKKDCCAKGCQSNYLGLNEECIDKKYIDLDALSCDKVCESKGGVNYTDQVYGDLKCCKKGSYLNDKCPVAAQIALGECEASNLT
jgi:hypothetical protein